MGHRRQTKVKTKSIGNGQVNRLVVLRSSHTNVFTDTRPVKYITNWAIRQLVPDQ